MIWVVKGFLATANDVGCCHTKMEMLRLAEILKDSATYQRAGFTIESPMQVNKRVLLDFTLLQKEQIRLG
jgi:hypothetical protein